MQPNFSQLVEQFAINGTFAEAYPYGSGHINDTYCALFQMPDGASRRYILQRINHRVFKEPEKLMSNIERVTQHLRAKIEQRHGDPQRETLNIVPTTDGKSFLKTAEGDYWRGYLFIERARTYDIVEKKEHLFSAGCAFGRFQKQLSDFPAETLFETIPDFHNTQKRYAAFIEAVQKDAVNRANSVRNEIQFIMDREKDAPILWDMQTRGELPLRVTHNDTKLNNVMIDDQTGEGICVIDLDTVMPGLSLYDFGDTIRSGTNTAAEDEPNLSKVHMSMDLFEAYAHGFLTEAGSFLTPKEIALLPFGAKMMTLECGMRFLADHLNGDTYFKVHRQGHNLDRCRTQLKLVADMEANAEALVQIVKRYA